MKAYRYTSLMSVMLLDCWSIPCVIVLTWIFLETKYGLRKFIGVECVARLILVVFSYVHASDRASKNMIPMKVLTHLHFCAPISQRVIICSMSIQSFNLVLYSSISCGFNSVYSILQTPSWSQYLLITKSAEQKTFVS